MKGIAAFIGAFVAAASATEYTCTTVSDGAKLVVNSVSNDWSCLTTPAVTHGENFTVNVRNEVSRYSGSQMQVIFFNPSRTAPLAAYNMGAGSGVFKVLEPNMDAGVTNPNNWGAGWHTAYNSNRDSIFYAAAGVFGDDGSGYACTGTYKFVVDLRSRDSGPSQDLEPVQIFYRLVTRTNEMDPTSPFPAMPGLGNVVPAQGMEIITGATLPVADMLLPGDVLEVPIKDKFATVKYMIHNATVTISGATGLVANQSQWSVSYGGGFTVAGPNPANTYVVGESITVNQRHIDYLPANVAEQRAQGTLRISVPQLNSAAYGENPFAWANNMGPFINFQAAANFRRYPILYDSDIHSGSAILGNGVIDVRPSLKPVDQVERQVFQVILDPLWWNMTVIPRVVVDVDPILGEVTAESRRELSLKFLWSTLSTPSTYDPSQSGFQQFEDAQTQSMYNDYVYTFNSADRRYSTVPGNRLAPVARHHRWIGFVTVEPGSCLSERVRFQLSAKVKSLEGECASYEDCVKDRKTDHPSKLRAKDSDNNDATRFSRCGVAPAGVPGHIVPETRCYECETDSDCGEGQYCQFNDMGMCTADGVGTYMCDQEAFTTAGLCKDKAKDILGKKCRVDTAEEFSSSSNLLNTEVIDGAQRNKWAPAYGYCGYARFYNESGSNGEYLGNGYVFSQKGGVRAIHWEGKCFNGVCQECLDGEPSGVSGRVCLNGKLMNTITVDQTLRTLQHNTVGGAIVAGICVFVFYMFCFGINMMNDANKHRENYGQGPMTTCDVMTSMVCCLPCCQKYSKRVDISARRLEGGVDGESTRNPLDVGARGAVQAP